MDEHADAILREGTEIQITAKGRGRSSLARADIPSSARSAANSKDLSLTLALQGRAAMSARIKGRKASAINT